MAVLSNAVAKLTLAYFQNINNIWRSFGHTEIDQFEACHCASPIPLLDDDINLVLVNAFQNFLTAAETGNDQQIPSLLNSYTSDLNRLFPNRFFSKTELTPQKKSIDRADRQSTTTTACGLAPGQ